MKEVARKTVWTNPHLIRDRRPQLRNHGHPSHLDDTCRNASYSLASCLPGHKKGLLPHQRSGLEPKCHGIISTSDVVPTASQCPVFRHGTVGILNGPKRAPSAACASQRHPGNRASELLLQNHVEVSSFSYLAVECLSLCGFIEILEGIIRQNLP
jgi:hypothetical protein